ncbi:MAG: citryl-CoA lyase [Alphaproteobacteria bacterium]|nr:citryl-CoA lyase [Alphaproteobacteria bacterium]
MSGKTPEEQLAEVSSWWTTGIIDIHPGSIAVRGYAIQDLIGKIGFAQMIWLMLRGELPRTGEARLLEAALVASVDHGPHAPSIAIARMAASIGMDLNNAMASAVNVLGDVHGGAGQQCMELYAAVAANAKCVTDLAGAVDEELAAFVAAHGKIIPGFGHRFHPIDPRCAPLLALVEEARQAGLVPGTYAAIGRAVEEGIRRRTGKPIPMNIDGVTAAIFCELGFPAPLGRGLFILSRSVGILAHAWEEMRSGSRMKGPMPRTIAYTYNGPAPRKPDFDRSE